MITRDARRRLRQTGVSAILAMLLAAGCGGDSPESMLASAKDFLAKNDTKAATIQLKNALQKNPDLAEARFLLGKALLDSGDPTGAELEFRKAQSLGHPADQVIPPLARAMLALGQAEKVTKDLSKVELSAPAAKADLQAVIGHAYLVQGKPDLAETAYSAALAAQPDHPPAVLGEARLKAGRNDIQGALALLDSALQKSPALYEAWVLKGDLLGLQANHDGAMQAFRKAIEAKPDLLVAHARIVGQLLATGNADDARKQVELMKQVAPNNPQTLYQSALVAYQKKELTQARETMQLMLRAVPESPLGLQLAGAIEYELKAFPQAEAYLTKALPRTPETGIARRLLIASYLRAGQPMKALSVLEPILDKIDKDSNMLALAGQVFMQTGQIDKAGNYFAKAAALDPNNTGKRTSLALVNLAKGDSEGAFRDLENLAAADTGNRADLALIAALVQRREFDGALKAIAALEKKQPSQPLTHNLRGAALLGKRDTQNARKSFEQALALDPAYYPAAANLASLDLSEKKPVDARKRFESVLAKDPKNLSAHLALAQLSAKTGGTTEEITTLIRKAISANPSEPAARHALIGHFLSQKDLKNALSAAQDAVAALPTEPQILDVAARAQQAAGDYNQASATLAKLAAIKPDSPVPYLRMAEVEVAAKNRDAAMQNLQKALKVKPDSLEAQRGLIMLELGANRTKEALAIAHEVQRQRPKEAVGYVFEGDAQASKKAWPEAIAAYTSGLKAVPGSADLAIKLHAAQRSNNNLAAADKLAEAWLKEHPADAGYRLYLAEDASLRKDYASAVKYYRNVLELQPNAPAVLNNLAWVSGQIKDPKALEYAERANKLAPEQPALMDTLAVLLVDKGETTRATDLFKKALDKAPDAHQIRLNYARALLKAGQKGAAKSELDQLAKLGDKFPQQAEVSQLLQGL
ncbi:MAG: PEP-CTERM system TPR-repeat protein PrsT [Candidatus Accumulibacter sp.]|uniref:XrtA/PEP-CTERM system TPR-repeat protein PrsT n=1 Tax=Accumulibacter sp. TaxID=2053492 RepID=UPI00287A92F1|nr:XrtA/PEP-CTERM system TPR-repeat protein PrsT [Accumulibacter sp.]MDS4013086.1 PEP-CTERM system TPR-repeat protein PrsT [Accumulibacter sp.]